MEGFFGALDDSRGRARWTAHSSFCSRSRAPTRRTMASSFGKMPTTSVRRLISPFRRSTGFVECSLASVMGLPSSSASYRNDPAWRGAAGRGAKPSRAQRPARHVRGSEAPFALHCRVAGLMLPFVVSARPPHHAKSDGARAPISCACWPRLRAGAPARSAASSGSASRRRDFGSGAPAHAVRIKPLASTPRPCGCEERLCRHRFGGVLCEAEGLAV